MQSVDAKGGEKKKDEPGGTDEDVCLADGCSWRHSAYCVICVRIRTRLRYCRIECKGLYHDRKMGLDYLKNNVN